MDSYHFGARDLADDIAAMDEAEICQFIRRESKTGGLSRTVRNLNRDILSKDSARRSRAKAAIERLGFI